MTPDKGNGASSPQRHAAPKKIDAAPARPNDQAQRSGLLATDAAPDRRTTLQALTIETERAEWLRQFVAAVARRAARPGPFTVFEVAKEANLPDPPHHTLWGSATGVAHREGLIVSVAATPSLRPRTAKSLVRLWIGARHAESGDAA